MKQITVGIIGGTGQMGRLFKKFFERNDCKVLISSRKTKIKPVDCAKQSDVVLISVPIDKTTKVIGLICPHIKKNALLIDTTSIKKEPVNAMLRCSSCEVVGMHPMFGPNVGSFKNQIVVLCPARAKKRLKWLKNILQRDEAIIKISTPEKHDKMMSIIQGLNHFNSLCMAHAMKSLGINLKESLEYASPIYELKISVIGKILNEDPNLYANVETANPENKKALLAYINSAKKLQKIIETKNKADFIKYFNACSKFFGGFKAEAEELTDYLIEQMVKKQK